jgi:hypothetical protein
MNMASAKSPVVFVFETHRNDWLAVARIVMRLVKASTLDLSLLHF